MKKFLKIFLLVPIFLLTVLFSFACGEEGIKSISLSLSTDYYTGIVGGYYNVKMTNINIPIEVKIEPNIVSASDLTWESSATNVATVYNSTLKTKGVGTTVITASYKNEDGSVVKGTMKVRVSSASEAMSFSADKYETTYTGESLAKNYKVIQDKGTTTDYTYSFFHADAETPSVVDDIVDVGTYQITCTKGTESCSTILIVKKAIIDITCGRYTITYGDDLPSGVYSNTNLPENILGSDQDGISIYGLGKDKTEKIGEYIQTTNAKKGSNAKSYDIEALFKIDNNFARNYDVEKANVTKGALNITSKNVVLLIKDQTITYGTNILGNNFSLYSYKEYIEAGNSVESITPLDETSVNYSSNINIGSATFMLNGNIANRNSAGYLNVLIDAEKDQYSSYDLCYNEVTTNGSNVIISVKINGKVTIEPREVTILPKRNQTKIYGENDPTTLTYDVVSGTFASQDSLPNFLQINYGDNEDYGEGNYLAPVEKYFYKINNELNRNYIFSLDPLAEKEEGLDSNENKVKFEVLRSEIIIKLSDLNDEKYCTPTGSDVNGNAIHTLSYYDYLQDGTVPNYIAYPESITVNGKEITDNVRGDITQNTLSEDFEESGFILLKTGGKLKFAVGLTAKSTPVTGYFMSYEVKSYNEAGDPNYSLYFDGVEANNFDVTILYSTINLKKLNITIIPNMTTSLISREYNATEGESSLPTGFMADYRVTGDMDGKLIEEIIVNYTEVLSLLNNYSQYTRVDEQGNINDRVSSIKDAGKYQIYLSKRLTFKPGMEYFNISLDESRIYYFTITKATAFILPSVKEDGSNQSKIYGDLDPEEFTYTHFGVAESDVDKFDGNLSRVKGENVGDYEITLGNLTLGQNYNLILSSDPVYFSITTREVKVEPISYETVYGDNNPTTIEYYTTIIGTYDESILVAPTFTGSLELKDATRINGYYPVCLDGDGNVSSYLIGRGTLACNDNYSMTFIETSTFKINRRQTIIDIVSQQVDSKDGLTITGLNLANTNYIMSNLLPGTTSNLIVNLDNTNDAFLEVKGEEFTITLEMGTGNDVSYCYEVIMGRKIVYNINVKIIYLSIVDNETKSTSTVNAVYNGDYRLTDFDLICQTEGFVIDETASSFSFKYVIGQTSANPKDVGSYVASVDLSVTGSKIVLKHQHGISCPADCANNETVEFTSLDGKIVKNCVLSISNYGYLNITRANLSYVANKLSFREPFSYGANADTLSDVSETYMDSEGNPVNIFYGVGTDSISLLRVGSRNFYYSASNYSLSLLDANKTYPIEVTVQAKKNGELDNNYNPLTISVPLQVIAQNLIISGVPQFNIGTGADLQPLPSSIVYDGISRPVTITLNIINDATKKYATTYNFIKLKSIYSDSTKASYEYYNYETGADGKPSLSESTAIDAFSNLSSVEDAEFVTINGINLLKIDNKCILLEEDNVGTPLKAGIYICIANCEAKNNYVFAKETAGGPVVIGTSKTYFKFYEIEKSSDVTIENWKESFYYTTQFDLTNPETLPFEYDMFPNFKDQVVYSMEEPTEWPTNNMLNVGNYSVNISVSNSNYYYSNSFTFEVTKLAAEFVFPASKTYVFKGENIAIVDFLNEIRILLKNKEGETIESFYYTYNDENPLISISFYEPFNENALDYIPWNVLDSEDDFYTLKMTYGATNSNYYGEGEFKYKIVKKAYTGQVRFQNASIIYNSAYTSEELYALIYSNMFSIGLSEGYTVAIFNENAIDPANSEIKSDIDTWIPDLLKEGQKTLRAEVSFADGITADYKATAILTIEKMSISQTEIVDPQGRSFTYNGYPVFNYLNFNNAPLNPETLEINASASITEQTNSDKKPYYLQYTNGRYVYTVFKTKEEGNLVELKVKDNLGNLIFTVTYTYQYEDATGSYTELKELNGSASVPNPSYTYHFPIDPRDKNYRVVYTYTFGNNYTGVAITLSYKDFKINKIPTLYISFNNNTENEELNNEWSNWNLPYNSVKTLNSRFSKDLLVVKNQSGGDNKTNVKLNVQVNDYTGYQLKRRTGIHLFVYFTDYSGNKDTTIYDANINGQHYNMHATIMYARYSDGPNEEGSNNRPYYAISDYVSEVKFGNNPGIPAKYFVPSKIEENGVVVDNVTSINAGKGYEKNLSQNVIVSEYLYNIDNWKEVFGSNTSNITIFQANNGGIFLKITKDSRIGTLTSNVNEIVIVKNQGGENIPTSFKITSSNYSFASFVESAEDYATTNRIYRFQLNCKKNYKAEYISFIVEKEIEQPTT